MRVLCDPFGAIPPWINQGVTMMTIATYADVDAVVTAVNGVPALIIAAFLLAAGAGVAFLTARLVSKGIKKGVAIG